MMSSSLLMPWGHAYIKDDVIGTINVYIAYQAMMSLAHC